MWHAGLDQSTPAGRLRVDDAGAVVAPIDAAPDADRLRDLAMRLSAWRVRAVIESMNGARFVHDTLEELGWECSSRTRRRSRGWRAGLQDRPRSTRTC